MTTATMETDVTSSAIAEYSPVEVALADLRRRTEGVLFEVTTRGGMEAAKRARAEIRGYRVDLEARRVELKAPVLERGRLLDAEAKRITVALTALEEPIDEQIKLEERRKEDERRARVAAEEARIAVIRNSIAAIRSIPLESHGRTVGQLTKAIVDVMAIDVDQVDPDYRAEAQVAIDTTLEQLTAMREQRREADAAAAKLEADRLALAEERKAEEARVAAENVARAEAQRVEDDARAARQREEDVARAERQRVEDEARATAQAVQDAAFAAEAARLREIAEADHDAREARETAERDARIASATLRSAAEAVLVWMDDRMYGHEPEAVTLRGVLALGEA